MNATAPPPKPAIVLATPINVEESRAQRLQRQQARFRDRGGIFVPTNRSTLLDILLGKVSPLKKPHRSASASPSRADEKASAPLRRSPRKQSQKRVDIATAEQLPAATESETGGGLNKKTTSKSSRPRPQKKAKAPPKSTTKPSRSEPSVVEDIVVDIPTEKSSKSTFDASEKKSLEPSTRKITPNADDDSANDIRLVKSNLKGKLRATETKSQGEADDAKGTSKTRGRRPAQAATKKVKKSTTSPKTASRISAAKDGLSTKASLLKDKAVVSMPTNSLNTSGDDGDDIPLTKSESKSKVTNIGHGNQEIDATKSRLRSSKKAEFEISEDDSKCKPTKKQSTKKSSGDHAASKPAKKSIAKKVKASAAPERCESSSSQNDKKVSNKTAPCRLPGIPEDEECNFGKEDSESSSNTVVSSPKGKKRANTSIAQNLDSQPRRKRVKSDTIQLDIDPSHHKTLKLSGETPLVTSKKRRRNPEDVESEVEDGLDKKSTKRKKRSGRSALEIPVEEDSVKPVAKGPRKTKVTKSANKDKKQSSNLSTTVSKRKENATVSKLSKKVATNNGPPKSVLQRIKDSLGAQVVDNEPDPIDFLS